MSVLHERESVTFTDTRGGDRTLRVSWHDDDGGLVVLSLWRDGTCTASFRLPRDGASELADLLLTALAAGRRRAHDPATDPRPIRTGVVERSAQPVDDPYVATRAPDYVAPDEQPATRLDADEPVSTGQDTTELALPSLSDWIFSGRAAG